MTNYNLLNTRGCQHYYEAGAAQNDITSGAPGRLMAFIADTASTDDVGLTFYDATTASGTDTFSVTVKGSGQIVANIPNGWTFSTGLSTSGGSIQRMTLFYILT